MKFRYALQTQAPDGNWVDILGSTRDRCEQHGRYLRTFGENVRVVERTDRVVWSATAETTVTKA